MSLKASPAREDVGQIVFRVFVGGERDLGNRAEFFRRQEFRAFVVERQAVGVHVVEPDVVGAAGVGLGEDEDGGGDAGVGFEHAAGQRDDGVEFLFFDENLAQRLVRVGRAEEHAVGHDDGGASAGFEQAQEEGEEEQLGLLRLDDLQEILGGVFVVERSGKRRIGEDQRVFLFLARVVLRQRVAVADVGIFHAVQQHVHAADAEHRVVEVEAVEKLMVEVTREFGVAKNLRMALAQIFARRDEKTRRAAGRIAHDVRRLRRDHLDHQPDDVTRRAELAVLAGGRDLGEHVLVQGRPWCRAPPSAPDRSYRRPSPAAPAWES